MERDMRFADILASLIHDMKNSLWLVINTLETFTTDPPPGADQGKVLSLQQEAKRLNTNLIELLTLYKIENERISPNIEELNIADFLEELVLENQVAASAQGIDLTCKCDQALNGFFDEGLIRGVVNSLIGNGIRYTSGNLLISGTEQEGYTVIRVEDDGEGFPREMLEAQDALDNHAILSEGRTQLGIYFAGMVAKMHRNKDREGYVRLTNSYQLKGGCFSICLP